MILTITLILALASIAMSVHMIRDMRKADAWKRHCEALDAEAARKFATRATIAANDAIWAGRR